MSVAGKKLFDLLPALYRLKDARIAQSQGLSQGPLEAILGVIAEQLEVVEGDLNQLYNDQFIETCAPWVIPYIGDLIGYQPANGVNTVNGVTGLNPQVTSSRAEVAHTISYRRRKGTILVIEQIARDVTGWGAHAVEFFRVLADTQYMNHVRPHNHYAPNLRKWEPRVYMDTGFDSTAHKVDVRRIAVERGRYNIQNVGIFLWSLNSYRLIEAVAPAVTDVPGQATCYRFSSLGADMPLFNNPVAQGADITAAAKPLNVPDRLPSQVLCRDIKRGTAAEYYGNGNSLWVYVGGALVTADKVQVCTLAGTDGAWANLPVASPYAVSIDPELGRLALPPSSAGAEVTASYCYGFNADMGGGPYPRSPSFAVQVPTNIVRVPEDQPTIGTAIQLLQAQSGKGVVEITNNGIYQEPAGLDVKVVASGEIELRASDTFRPTLVLGGPLSVTGGKDSRFDINGLLVTYAPPAGSAALPPALVTAPKGAANKLSHLGLTHCTLVPGWALTPNGNPVAAYSGLPTLSAEIPGVEVVISQSIVGGLKVHAQATAYISDSLVDASGRTGMAYRGFKSSGSPDFPQPGGALTLQRCTVVGRVHSTLLSLVSDSVIWADLTVAEQGKWAGALWAERLQEGCVRFSYLPRLSAVPPPFECVVEGDGSTGPLFASLQYGQPAYGKILSQTDDSVRRGADNGGEMGAFNSLLAPLRESNLSTRMQEYLPVGLEFGIFYQT
jgi:hypothetical protein